MVPISLERRTWGIRTILFQDLLDNGLKGGHIGGLQDRMGNLNLFFDADPSIEPVRRRAVVDDAEHPQVRRRRSQGMAPGYAGRKRGEVQRSRLTLQQAHTSEWLGSWGNPGNGDRWAELRDAAVAVVDYMSARGLAAHQAVVRLDGAYGRPWTPFILTAHYNVGYITRCVDYQLLKRTAVRHALKTQSPVSFHQPDTGTLREVFDVGPVTWQAAKDPEVKVVTRLIVTRRRPGPKEEDKAAIGKKRGRWIYELFVTDRPPEGLEARDIVSLYFGRGGFETQLHYEDEETDPGRWLSGFPEGQDVFALLCQHVWNVRLRLGQIDDAEAEPRQTVWADGSDAPEAQGEVSPSIKEEVRCLLGRVLTPLKITNERVWFLAPNEICDRVCTLHVDCVHTEYKTSSGLPVGLMFGGDVSEGHAVPRHSGSHPVLWMDWPARQLRNRWWNHLQTQQLDVIEPPRAQRTPPAVRAPMTRAQRANRRHCWRTRQRRNQCPDHAPKWQIVLHGLPEAIRHYVRIPVTLAT